MNKRQECLLHFKKFIEFSGDIGESVSKAMEGMVSCAKDEKVDEFVLFNKQFIEDATFFLTTLNAAHNIIELHMDELRFNALKELVISLLRRSNRSDELIAEFVKALESNQVCMLKARPMMGE